MRPVSKPKRPTGLGQSEWPYRLDRNGVDQLGRGLQDQIGAVVNLVEAPDYPVVQKQKARGSVKSGSPFAISIQRCKAHGSNYSKRGDADSYRRSDRLLQRDRHTAKRLQPLAYVLLTAMAFTLIACLVCGRARDSAGKWMSRLRRQPRRQRVDARFCSASCRKMTGVDPDDYKAQVCARQCWVRLPGRASQQRFRLGYPGGDVGHKALNYRKRLGPAVSASGPFSSSGPVTQCCF